jgi:hypothetical protein
MGIEPARKLFSSGIRTIMTSFQPKEASLSLCDIATVHTAFERSSAKSSAAEDLPYASDSYLSRLGVLYLDDPSNTRPWNITWAAVTVFSTVVVGLIDGWTWRVLSWSLETLTIGQGLPMVLSKLKPRIPRPFYSLAATVLYLGAPVGLSFGVMSPFLYQIEQSAAVAGYYGLAIGVAAVIYYSAVLALFAYAVRLMICISRFLCSRPRTAAEKRNQIEALMQQHGFDDALSQIGDHDEKDRLRDWLKLLEEHHPRLLLRILRSEKETRKLMRHKDPIFRIAAIHAGNAVWRLQDTTFLQLCRNVALHDPHYGPRRSAIGALSAAYVRSPDSDIMHVLITIATDSSSEATLRNQAYLVILASVSHSATAADRYAQLNTLQAAFADTVVFNGEDEQLLEIDCEIIKRAGGAKALSVRMGT